MQTGEDSFMQTLDWCQLDWQGMNAKKSWGHHTQQHRGAGTSKRKAQFFDTEGRITGQASTLTVHHSAFVDYRLVFPRRTQAQADRTHIRVSLRVSWKKQQKSKQRLCQMIAGPVSQGRCTAERNIYTIKTLTWSASGSEILCLTQRVKSVYSKHESVSQLYTAMVSRFQTGLVFVCSKQLQEIKIWILKIGSSLLFGAKLKIDES